MTVCNCKEPWLVSKTGAVCGGDKFEINKLPASSFQTNVIHPKGCGCEPDFGPVNE